MAENQTEIKEAEVVEETSQIKFSEEELKSLTDLRDAYATIQNDFGVIKVRKVLVNQQLENLENAEIELETKYVEAQQNEQELVKTLNDKYGPGNLNPETGEFTPIPPAQ
tara:strand:- start:229 stop:558 length:330 start_codon:yes stop_codon:yes gene_type:complete